ncbi:hypothetical protein DFH28DRAFT_1130350 [Melampsora americana]|nr:hypothetical protein DFH28DRAFT_1130350 [Melampsora americana]
MLFFKTILFAALVATISADAPNTQNDGLPAVRRSVPTSSRMTRREDAKPEAPPTGSCGSN